MKPYLKITFALLIAITLVLGFALPLNPAGNWYQQFLPAVGSRSIQDVFFIDSLTGFAVTNATNQSNDTIFVLKTTNSGDNWSIHYAKIQTGGGFPGYFRVYFLNQNTGYTCGVTGIDKTTNGGTNWVSLNAPNNSYLDMSILNTDTIWIVSSNSLTGGVFRTTNGGNNWNQQLSLGSQNPSKIYVYNSRIGYIAKNTGSQYIRKTTDSGLNWNVITSTGGYNDIFFTDSLRGWLAYDSVRRTTNGGINWQTQILPSGLGITALFPTRLSVISSDTIWVGGGRIIYPNSQGRGMLFRTTNQGVNWLYQVPDTSIVAGIYSYVKFMNNRIGWAYSISTGIHTTNGGDTMWYIGVHQTSSSIPKNYELHQNYPNPFNPKTIIPFSLKQKAYVNLSVYDITGKLIQIMVDGYYSAGEYEADFMGKFISSGVYFYKLTVTSGKEVFSETKKMMLVK